MVRFSFCLQWCDQGSQAGGSGHIWGEADNFYKWFQFRNEDLTGSRVEVLLYQNCYNML